MRAGINALTAAFVVVVAAGLALTPDGRAWIRQPTLLLGEKANASAPAERPEREPQPAAATERTATSETAATESARCTGSSSHGVRAADIIPSW